VSCDARIQEIDQNLDNPDKILATRSPECVRKSGAERTDEVDVSAHSVSLAGQWGEGAWEVRVDLSGKIDCQRQAHGTRAITVPTSPPMPLRVSPSPINTPTVRSASVSRLRSPELSPRSAKVPPACLGNVGDGVEQTLGSKYTIPVQPDHEANWRTDSEHPSIPAFK
jgi:hypothetical protein